jgi:hypothetical protein
VWQCGQSGFALGHRKVVCALKGFTAVNALYPQTTRNTSHAKQVGRVSQCSMGEHIPSGGLSILGRGCSDPVTGWFGDGFKETDCISFLRPSVTILRTKNDKNLFLNISGGWESKIKVSSRLCFFLKAIGKKKKTKTKPNASCFFLASDSCWQSLVFLGWQKDHSSLCLPHLPMYLFLISLPI